MLVVQEKAPRSSQDYAGRFLCASRISSGQGRWIVYFVLYLDESGKSHFGDYTALCGYCASVDEWARFNINWDNLRYKWQVPPIHLSRIMFPQSKEDDWKKKHDWLVSHGVNWDQWRDTMLDEFAQLVQISNTVCVGSVVDAKAYKRIKTDPECKLVYDDSNVFLLQNAIARAIDSIEVVDRSPSLCVYIDDDRENAKRYYDSYWNLKTMLTHPQLPESQKPRFERIERIVDSIGFCNDKVHPGVQAADMISYIARSYKREPGRDEIEKLYAQLTRGGTNQPQYYPENILYEVGSRTGKFIEAAKDEENCPDGI